MGTSASGIGPKPTTPLIPNWIIGEPLPPEDEPDRESNENDEEGDKDNTSEGNAIVIIPNRYMEARRNYNVFSQNRTTGTNDFTKALRSYVRKGSGGSITLARRMTPSASRVSQFYSVLNTFQSQGSDAALLTFNLESYNNQPLLDVLSALTEVIFDNTSIYHDIQDDSITKLAYINTINRIVEIEGIDLDTLTNENIEVMLAIFIEETISTKVICDIGVKLFEKVIDVNEIIEVEETAYQIVSGLVRTQIMPEIIATQRGQAQNIERNIQNIYRIAFDCIAGISTQQ